MAALLAALTLTGCGAQTTTQLVHRFVANANARHVAAAERAFAPEPAFQWFSARGRTGPEAYDRSTLRAYLGRLDARLAITRFGAGYDPRRDLVDFGGMIRIGAAAAKPFKGAASCATGAPLLIVWSM
jgi:hypothetical protein